MFCFYVDNDLSGEPEFIDRCMTCLRAALAGLNTDCETSVQSIQRGLYLLKHHIECFRQKYAYQVITCGPLSFLFASFPSCLYPPSSSLFYFLLQPFHPFSGSPTFPTLLICPLGFSLPSYLCSLSLLHSVPSYSVPSHFVPPHNVLPHSLPHHFVFQYILTAVLLFDAQHDSCCIMGNVLF